MASLDGARAKLDRSAKHIAEMATAARVYLHEQPFGVIRVEEPNGDLVWRIKVHKSVPAEWSVIIGDAVHNMRSALDLMAWQLVEANGGVPSRDTCFPIGQTSSGYDHVLRRALAGASPSAIGLVKRLKPYAGGNPILGQLHALDITDKHRLVLVAGAAYKHMILKTKMSVPWQETQVEFPPIALSPADRQFPIRDGAAVFGVSAAARGSESISEPGFVFELAFGDVAEVVGLPLVPTLESMHLHVSKIVGIFGRHFF